MCTPTIITEQKQQFKSHLDMVLYKPYRCKIQLDDNGLIAKVKLNTEETLHRNQIDLLNEVADAYNLDYRITRSGLGIKIEFILKIQD